MTDIFRKSLCHAPVNWFSSTACLIPSHTCYCHKADCHTSYCHTTYCHTSHVMPVYCYTIYCHSSYCHTIVTSVIFMPVVTLVVAMPVVVTFTVTPVIVTQVIECVCCRLCQLQGSTVRCRSPECSDTSVEVILSWYVSPSVSSMWS